MAIEHPVDEDLDGALLVRYQAGDSNALAVLVERHSSALYRMAMSMTGQAADAEDVVQEVWRRVVRKAGGFRGDSFPGWIFRICRNHLIDRSRGRRLTVSLDEHVGDGEATRLDMLPGRGLEPDAAAERKEWCAQLAVAVDALSAEQKEVFLLRAEGLDYKEIARVQGVLVNTALARMHYAVGKLRKCLGSEFATERRGT